MPAEVGKPAPDFTLSNISNEPVKLSSFRGKNVLLAVVVGAFTSG